MAEIDEPPSIQSEPIEEKFQKLLWVAEACVGARIITPALVLVYSGIDAAGWLYSANPNAASWVRFTAWVSKYLLPAGNLGCTPLELYGARCGIVHNFTSESNLSKEGKVRQIIYAWGASSIDTLREMSAITKMEDFTEVKVEGLIASFRQGLAHFFEDAAANPKIAARLAERSGKILGPMSDGDGKALLKWVKDRI